jgi:hypothetical protein
VNGTDLTFTLPAKVYNGSGLTIKDLANDLQTVITAHASKPVLKVRVDANHIVIASKETISVATGHTAAGLLLSGAGKLTKESGGLINKGSFAQTVADFCASKTIRRQAMLGYIGIRPPADAKVSTVRAFVNGIDALDTEISPYLQIVGHETSVVLPGTNAIVFTNGATHYAALVSQLSPQSAPTNKVLKGVRGIPYEFSLAQLSKFTTKKIVTFRLRDNPLLGRQLVVTDGITSAPFLNYGGQTQDSDYARLSTLRITQLAIQAVREATDPFIGEPNDMPQYNALNTAVKSALEKLRESGVIRGYTFSIQAVSSRLDQANVVLQIIPAFELRRIEVEVSLTYSDQVLFGGSNVQA